MFRATLSPAPASILGADMCPVCELRSYRQLAADRALGLDRQQPSLKAIWLKARRTEIRYASQLRKIARHVGDIVQGFDPDNWTGNLWLTTALRRYADTIEPWAQSVAKSMVAEAAARDKTAWNAMSAQMGVALRKELETAPIGDVLRQSMQQQVTLIKSIPLEAAERVHGLVYEGMFTATRPKEIAAEIMRQGDVSRSKAMLIARTETGRVSTELTKARALHVGSEYFTWRTAGDSDVREDHKKLNLKVFKWTEPPIADERTGTRALPGSIWNCRCVGIPLLED